MAYTFQAVPHTTYPPFHETIGEATMRAFKGADAARPMTDDELTCPFCGFIVQDGTTAQVAHDELCMLRADGACEEFVSVSFPAGECTTCGWERGYHEHREAAM